MTEERLAALRAVEQNLSLCFRDISLLDTALTHRSFANENPVGNYSDNERLEFLGDAVIGLCISDMLMEKFPDDAEGQLSKLRASLVNEQPLAKLAKRFSIGDYLLLELIEAGGNVSPGEPLVADQFSLLTPAEKGGMLNLGNKLMELVLRHFQHIGLLHAEDLCQLLPHLLGLSLFHP